MNKKIIIAIDGYSSSGKSTIAKATAKHLGFKYIDSGAMYRVVTLFAIRNKLIDKTNSKINEEELKKQIDSVHINFKINQLKDRQEIYLNNENVEDEIREMEVSNLVSFISKLKFVREKMVRIQQELGKEKGIVMDGRDIGTVVFPNAELKIFMNAKAEVRAERRYKELKEKGVVVSYEEILENVKSRDHHDETRDESPLRKAHDAIELDNSNMSETEQLNWILGLIEKLK
ncbi:MAG: cytidylate kinase [Bacteroidetes bacterium GWF2_33_16]|nr:MAG: cytidylate kinase [Bacteroidetes bacterium GWE2_32_14]OFY05174.1 MAG: cytidylate kinase [Bacteroidetes bacterium GWF2_33_16]